MSKPPKMVTVSVMLRVPKTGKTIVVSHRGPWIRADVGPGGSLNVSARGSSGDYNRKTLALYAQGTWMTATVEDETAQP